jgi:acyl carrier protein
VEDIYQRYGELNGVVYAAGSTDQDRFMPLLEDTCIEDCEKHFESKVHGLRVLEQVVEDRELDFCLLCSSVASVLGGLGFAAYSAANIFVDSVAQRRRSQVKSNWISVNWDAWRFDDESATRAFADTDLAKLAITPDEGVKAFERLLSVNTEPQVIVSTGDLNARIKRHVSTHTSEKEATEQSVTRTFYPRPETGSAFVAPRNESEQLIAAIWQDLLGLERVGVNDNFFQLGGHSLLATRVNTRLRETFQVDLPLPRFFQAPTLGELADTVLEQMIERHDSYEVEQLLEDVQQMSAHN